MKKAFIACILALCMLVAGCSCNGAVTLSFNNKWHGGTIQTGYSVTFKNDFIDGDDFNYKQNEEVATYFVPMFNQGEYTSTVTVIDQSAVPSHIQSDVLDLDATTRSPIIKQTTSFSISGEYTPTNGEKVAFNDTAQTESYFRLTDTSLAPIYSETISVMNFPSINTKDDLKGIKVNEEKVATVFLYNKSEYSVKQYTNEKDSNRFDEYMTDKTSAVPTIEREIDYSYRSVIDNTALLFALRNVNVTANAQSSTSILATSPAYKVSTQLNVKCYQTKNQTVDSALKINDVDIDDNVEIPVNCLSFAINAQNSGRDQLVYVQNNIVKNADEEIIIPNKALLTKYVTPLVEYGSYYLMGVLEYNLTSVSID